MNTFSVILPAAGQSSRFQGHKPELADFDSPLLRKKQFAALAGAAVWVHSARKFIGRPDVIQIIIAIAEEDRAEFERKFHSNIVIDGIEVVSGGAQRADSIRNAMARVKPEAQFVCIHDAARPCVSSDLIDKVFAKAVQTGAATLACPVSDTLKRVDPKTGFITQTVSRTGLWGAQTPQVFRRDWIQEAYKLPDSSAATDDCMLIEQLGHKVSVVESSRVNLKITTQSDLQIAAQLLSINKKRSPLDFI